MSERECEFLCELILADHRCVHGHTPLSRGGADLCDLAEIGVFFDDDYQASGAWIGFGVGSAFADRFTQLHR